MAFELANEVGRSIRILDTRAKLDIVSVGLKQRILDTIRCGQVKVIVAMLLLPFAG